MLKKLTVENYKSIRNATIELSRINIFIGENGCGKTNILEALAMASASKALALHVEGLSNRGIRVAKPNLTFSSFIRTQQKNKIIINIELQEDNAKFDIPSTLYCDNDNDIYSKWKDESRLYLIDEKEIHLDDINGKRNIIREPWLVHGVNQLTNYSIFTLNSKVLRGIGSESKKTPLGINGEGLDVLLSQFTEQEWKQLQKYHYLISWLEKTFTDKKDSLKLEGYKLGRSHSVLYFKDKFMQKKNMNNVLSAENANDGVLHVLFYLALFISKKTPAF